MAESKFHNYSFLVDGGLRVSARAQDEATAKTRIQNAWPRGTIELIGVDMPQAERSINRPAPVQSKSTKKRANKVESLVSKAEVDSNLGLTETEASLVANFV